jgi:hypothetical protein
MKGSPIRRTLCIALPLGLLVGEQAALAAVSRLDQADQHVAKLAAVKEADSTPTKKPAPTTPKKPEPDPTSPKKPEPPTTPPKK